MATKPPKPLMFTVRRSKPELVAPAEQTPHEYKPLSDIDDQDGLRFHIPIISFYKYNPIMEGKDPAKVVKEAIAKTLVHYYPLAGRLREFKDNRKLVVDCTGEGLLFIEADADVTLEEFGEDIYPPFPCVDQLLYDVPGTSHMINTPLFLIQVTRLKCGGFIFGLRFNHTIGDSIGILQFLDAVGEMAKGALSPSISPLWERHLLDARVPPHVTCTHHEYDMVLHTKRTITSLDDDIIERFFFFGPKEISTICRLIPTHLPRSSTFEILTAILWRCLTIAFKPEPNEEMRMIYSVNARSKFNPPIPKGFYGNGCAYPAALSAANKLVENPLEYSLDLIKKAKQNVSEEYMKSMADLMVLNGRLHVTTIRSYAIADLTRVKFEQVDFGWGKSVYSGMMRGGIGVIPGLFCLLTSFRNKKGEYEIVVPICLPSQTMEVFANELDAMLQETPHQPTSGGESSSIVSRL